MRFFEFLQSNQNNTISNLVDIVKDPDVDPQLKKDILAIFQQLKLKDNSEEKQNEALNNNESELISVIEDDEAYWQRILNTDSRLKAIAEKKVKEATESGFNLGTALSDSKRKEIEQKSKKVASIVGKDEAWGSELSERLQRFKDDALVNLLLDNSINNSCFKDPTIFKNDGVVKGKLQNYIIPELSGIFTNPSFLSLVQLPFDKRGLGPGESVLAILIPDAKKASKGDLEIDGEIWEVKGAGYKADGSDNQSWIDSAGINVKGNTLGEIFRTKINSILGKKIPKVIEVDGQVLDFDTVLNLADFRSKSLPKLSSIMKLLKYDKRVDVLDSIYSKMFPGCKEKLPDDYRAFIDDSIRLINEQKPESLARLQSRFSLKEYGLGAYNSPNFIFYNPSYQDVVFSKGVASVDEFYNDPQFSVSTITMKGDKPSTGIFLKSPEVVRRKR